MRVIMNRRDLITLKQANVLPLPYMNFLEEEWFGLYEALGEEDINKFNLKEHGYMVCLEPGDLNLEPVGLEEGLVNSWAEYINKVPLGDITIYRIGILYNNEFMMLFYSVVGTLDAETEAWLEEHVEI